MLTLLLSACGGVSVPLDPVPDGGRAPADEADSPDAIVDCAGGGDFETISDAVDAAEDGDTIAVWPCDYDETIDFAGKQLHIRSTGGSADTIVEARNAAVVRAIHGEGTGTTLEGFTLRGGGNRSEPAVHADFSSLRLVDVVLEDNGGWTTIYGASADLQLDGVVLRDNAPTYGVSIYVSKGAMVATDLTLSCDGSTGIYFGHGGGLVDRAEIDCGMGTAVHWEHAVGHVQRSVVEGDVTVLAEDDHYDDFVYVSGSVVRGSIAAQYGSLWVRNTVVTEGISLTTVYLDTHIESSVIYGASCGVTADSADFTLRNNVFWDNRNDVCGGVLTDPVGANGNLGEDPGFVDARGGDWQLDAGSPAIDAGPDEDGYADPDGSRNDIGAYGGPLSLGGGY